MGGNGVSSGSLTIQAALERARNPNLEEDPVVTAFLEAALREVWLKIEAHPNYILTDDEFSLFNYFRHRYEDSQVSAIIARYWDSKSSDSRNSASGGHPP
jgi:hypothetical protein